MALSIPVYSHTWRCKLDGDFGPQHVFHQHVFLSPTRCGKKREGAGERGRGRGRGKPRQRPPPPRAALWRYHPPGIRIGPARGVAASPNRGPARPSASAPPRRGRRGPREAKPRRTRGPGVLNRGRGPENHRGTAPTVAARWGGPPPPRLTVFAPPLRGSGPEDQNTPLNTKHFHDK